MYKGPFNYCPFWTPLPLVRTCSQRSDPLAPPLPLANVRIFETASLTFSDFLRPTPSLSANVVIEWPLKEDIQVQLLEV